MAEMNGSWNPYCAYNADGSARGHGHSTKSFRHAWRRFTMIIRGGSVARINARLQSDGHARGPREGNRPAPAAPQGGDGLEPADDRQPGGERQRAASLLARAPVRRLGRGGHLLEVRDARGSAPRSAASTPTTAGSRSRSASTRPGTPTRAGRFTKWLFRWAAQRGRARGCSSTTARCTAAGPYDINHYPDARRALRRILNQQRWISVPAGDPAPPAPVSHRTAGSIAPVLTSIPFELRGLHGTVEVEYLVNQDPARWGYPILEIESFDVERARGCPVARATGRVPGGGLRGGDGVDPDR